MTVLYIITALLVAASFLANRARTVRALRIALRRFLEILPAFLLMLIFVSIALYILPDQAIARLIDHENKWAAMAAASGLGSISVIPGFIAFPLCGLLREKGVLYMVLSAFSTTLMMVGVVTFPIERAYLGLRLALWRNAIALLIALMVAIATGLYFGELP
jgi:uncharacterized membrane protein YraQ (UPF0718 family)